MPSGMIKAIPGTEDLFARIRSPRRDVASVEVTDRTHN